MIQEAYIATEGHSRLLLPDIGGQQDHEKVDVNFLPEGAVMLMPEPTEALPVVWLIRRKHDKDPTKATDWDYIWPARSYEPTEVA